MPGACGIAHEIKRFPCQSPARKSPHFLHVPCWHDPWLSPGSGPGDCGAIASHPIRTVAIHTSSQEMVMNDASRLKEVIQVATDSATFYTRALEKVEDPHVRRVLTDMGQHKRDLIVSLRQTLHIDDATVDPDGTFSGAMRRAYADLLAMISSDDDKVYVGQLEEMEDKLLANLREAISEVEDPRIVAILQSHLPRIAACHNEMRTLKASLSA
jgi:uncharacterized protein (TIGR02284 family)